MLDSVNGECNRGSQWRSDNSREFVREIPALLPALSFNVSDKRSFMRTRLLSLAAVWIAILCMALPAFAQGERGAITGLITDAVGAVVPNVNVTATQSQTGTTFKAVSTSVGVYRIPYLPSGNYRVTAELKGFKIAIVEPVVVAVAAVVT